MDVFVSNDIMIPCWYKSFISWFNLLLILARVTLKNNMTFLCMKYNVIVVSSYVQRILLLMPDSLLLQVLQYPLGIK